MGRAIIREPKVFLMDEPLSNLDAKLRTQMRVEITKLQRELGTTTIYVTHDQVEAMTMGTRIAVMRKGVLQQEGSPLDVYNHPANLFVASFIGSPAMNLFRGSVSGRGDSLSCAVGPQELSLADAAIASHPRLRQYAGRDVAVGIRPDYIEVAEPDSASSVLEATVSLVEPLGAQQLVHFELEAAPVVTDEVLEVAGDTDAAIAQTLEAGAAERRVEVVARVASDVTLATGERSRFAIPGHRLHFFDLETGQALSES
jgi:multiple sugar transport system ATP-binding protein